jgi:hypothetical protein
MKWFLMVMLFSCFANAKDKMIVSISSVTSPEINRVETIHRPADNFKVLDRNKQLLSLGSNDVNCEISFYDKYAVIGCEQTKDNKNRMITESGFGVSSIVDCSIGQEKEISFSNKTKKSGKWAMFELKLKCEQDKI